MFKKESPLTLQFQLHIHWESVLVYSKPFLVPKVSKVTRKSEEFIE